MRRVVITGLGVNCSIGRDVDEFWNNCLEGKTNIEKIPENWSKMYDSKSKYWSPLLENDYLKYHLKRSELSTLDKSSQLILCTTKQAFDSAAIEIVQKDRRTNTFAMPEQFQTRSGVFVGTGMGGISTIFSAAATAMYQLCKENASKSKSEEYERIQKEYKVRKYLDPYGVSKAMPNACAANIGIKYSITGPNHTYCASCSSGAVAIGTAYRWIKEKRIDMAVAGGTEYLYDELGVSFFSFDKIGALTSGVSPDDINCPFDKKRSGFLFSEGGAATLILEDLESALKRNAPILAEIAGYEESSDAYSIMAIDSTAKSIEQMSLKCLEEAGIQPEAIDYINAHGTGTVLNDEIEAKVIEKIYRQHPIVNSTKSLIGHTLGASAAIGTLTTVLSLKHSKIHGSKSLMEPCSSLRFATETQSVPIQNALVQSFGFGGHNAILVLKKYQA